MSKFIRTKEGIYELKKGREIVERWDIAGNPHLIEYEYNNYSEENDEYDLGVYISQADTIDELCDEFVFSSDVSNYVIDKKSIEHCKTTILKIYEDNKDTDYVKAMHPKFYGAIWTDKGLIYVAKLNDKGELELI